MPKTNKNFIFSCLFILLVSITFFFTLAPSYVEKSRNKIVHTNHPHIPANTKTFHNTLTISDLHADSLLWNRDLTKKSDYAHVDIPRLINGNIALQVFSVVTKTPKGLNLISNSDKTDNITLLAMTQLWPSKTWNSLFERAKYQAEKLHHASKRKPDEFFLIRSKQDLQKYLKHRQTNKKITAGILSLEGAHALEGDIDNVDRLFALGYRIIGFTHFFDNQVGGSAHGIDKYGITSFGEEVLWRMDKLGMFIDLSHASPTLIDDILARSSRPLLATHTGIQAVCQTSHRNLSDKHIKQVAKSGGLIGIGFWPAATCTNDISGIVKSIQYVVNLVGEDYVALGSDFDGNVQVPFASDEMSILTHALTEAKFTKTQIGKIMGGNIVRVFLQNLPN